MERGELLIFNIILLTVQVATLAVLVMLTKQIADGRVKTPYERAEKELDNEFQRERIEREASFDARIAQIKDELAKQHEDRVRRGNIADVLDPNIQNLPHNNISDVTRAPAKEYAE